MTVLPLAGQMGHSGHLACHNMLSYNDPFISCSIGSLAGTDQAAESVKGGRCCHCAHASSRRLLFACEATILPADLIAMSVH